MRIRLPSIEKLSFGYRFDRDREIVSLIFLNYFYIVLFSVILIFLYRDDEEIILVTYRYHAFILLALAELWLIRTGFINLARILILSLTPFLILILPPLAGLFDNEFYFWFPYVPIALSIVPHFILHTSRNRVALLIVIGIYFLLVLCIDNYLILLSDGSEEIIPYVIENRFYYNLVPLVIFVFVNLTIGLVFANNYKYELIVLRQHDELVQSEKMASLGTLTTGIAHEINNPLNFISGSLHALNILKDEYLDLQEDQISEKKELLQKIEKIMENSFEGVRRATDIIASLKFFANPGLTEKTLHDLQQIFHSVLLSIEKKIPYHISVVNSIPAGMQVCCYEKQLRQVLQSIMENALEAIEEMNSRENRKIEIASSESRRQGIPVKQISISNNGPAIPEKEIKKIFDPFYSMKSKGKGLGMAISYMIIKEHGGWIEAKNENGMVVFEVILPKD